jgi:hypothetical protein
VRTSRLRRSRAHHLRGGALFFALGSLSFQTECSNEDIDSGRDLPCRRRQRRRGGRNPPGPVPGIRHALQRHQRLDRRRRPVRHVRGRWLGQRTVGAGAKHHAARRSDVAHAERRQRPVRLRGRARRGVRHRRRARRGHRAQRRGHRRLERVQLRRQWTRLRWHQRQGLRQLQGRPRAGLRRQGQQRGRRRRLQRCATEEHRRQLGEPLPGFVLQRRPDLHRRRARRRPRQAVACLSSRRCLRHGRRLRVHPRSLAQHVGLRAQRLRHEPLLQLPQLGQQRRQLELCARRRQAVHRPGRRPRPGRRRRRPPSPAPGHLGR